MNRFKILIFFIILFFTWVIGSIIEEIVYPNYCNYKNYKIELHYLNGEIETKIFNLPENIHLQVNCGSHKNSHWCDLEYLQKDLILSSGHWIKLKSGINEYKLININ